MVYYPLALECNKPATPTLTISITSTNPQNHTIAHFSLGKPLSAFLIELPTHNNYYTAHNPPPPRAFHCGYLHSLVSCRIVLFPPSSKTRLQIAEGPMSLECQQ